jgi:hypothetical protein
MSEHEPPRDEWTMICPPGCMDVAEMMASAMPENIREIVESPVAGDQFILVNDSQMDRFWAGLKTAPIQFKGPPRMIDHYRLNLVNPVVSDPAALTLLGGA